MTNRSLRFKSAPARRISYAIALLASVSLAASAQAVSFEFHELGSLGTSSTGSSYTTTSGNGALNSSGQAVGSSTTYSATDTNLGSNAFVWNSATGIRDLGNMGSNASGTGGYGYANGINDAGQVIGGGTKYEADGSYVGGAAFFWDPTHGRQEIAGFGGTTTANGINAFGEVAAHGTLVDSSGFYLGSQAFRWSSGDAPQLLENFGQSATGQISTSAVAINDAGQIAGYGSIYDASGNSLGTQAIRWEADGTGQLLGHLGTNSAGAATSRSVDINASGAVLAEGDIFDSAGKNKGRGGFYWDETGGVQNVGNLGEDSGGYSYTYVYDMNDSGQVTGYSNVYDAAGTKTSRNAFIWDATKGMIDLGVLALDANGGGGSFARAINASGLVVGASNDYDQNGISLGVRAVLWDACHNILDLNDYVDASLGWTLQQATAINDSGDILGWGTNAQGNRSAFVMFAKDLDLSCDPGQSHGVSDSGTTAVLMATSLLGLIAGRRRLMRR